MKSIAPGVFVGTITDIPGWKGRYIAAAKEPCHRQALQYTGRGAPKDHPEYLVALRGMGMILNLVDGESPDWIDKGMIQQSLDFICPAENTLIACNQGRSRSPSIALMWMLQTRQIVAETFYEAEDLFKLLYSDYAPANGIRLFSKKFFEELS